MSDCESGSRWRIVAVDHAIGAMRRQLTVSLAPLQGCESKRTKRGKRAKGAKRVKSLNRAKGTTVLTFDQFKG